MNDLLPEQSALWQYVESNLRATFSEYAYQEIRPNLIEKTHLFQRSIGELTDIVSKEMYSFSDRNDESLTLRPEGTAGCVRAAIEHSLAYNNTPRLWMMGPMFRYERPQKGRYRQFHQVAAEVFGIDDAHIDVELILMTASLWKKLGIAEHVKLNINSLGSSEDRQAYHSTLVDYFKDNFEQLDEDSKTRLESNPLRILDSKNPDLQALITAAPSILEHLSDESQAKFKLITQCLEAAGVVYHINTRLVRGLDYYNDLVFEWSTQFLGAQDAVCGGGRYDGLFEQLGGQATPAVGFAIGMERLIELVKLSELDTDTAVVDAYIVNLGDRARQYAMIAADKIRSDMPGFKVKTHLGQGSFKSQFKHANKSGATFALIIGDDEVDNSTLTLKYMREDKEQLTATLESIIEVMKNHG